MTKEWGNTIPPNYFVGTSLNEVAMSITEEQSIVLTSFPGKPLPVNVVTYPCFETGPVTNGSVVYVPSARGYYCLKILRS